MKGAVELQLVTALRVSVAPVGPVFSVGPVVPVVPIETIGGIVNELLKRRSVPE